MKKLSFLISLLLVFSCFAFAACSDAEGDTSKGNKAESSVSSDVENSSIEAIVSSSEEPSETPSETPSASEEPSEPESSAEPSDASSDDASEPESPSEEPAGPIQLTGNLISVGCEYEVPGGKGYVVEDDKWPANYTANLTDDVALGQLTYNSSWFSFNTEPDIDGEANTIDGVGTAIIDLGEIKNVTGVKANIFSGDPAASIAPIGSIVVSVSQDGETYSNPFKLNLPTTSVGWAEGGCQEISARYVKVEFVKGGEGFHMFTNEIQVYGK